MVRKVHYHLFKPATKNLAGILPLSLTGRTTSGNDLPSRSHCLRRRTGIQSQLPGPSQGREPQGRPCKRGEPTGSTPSPTQRTNAAARTALALWGSLDDRLEGSLAHSCRTQKNMTLRTAPINGSRPIEYAHRLASSRVHCIGWLSGDCL
jgi:hypothetical protein